MISSYTAVRSGNSVWVVVTSDLDNPWFYWFADGQFLTKRRHNGRGFLVAIGEQARVEVIDSLDGELDPLAIAVEGWPARRTLWWLRSLAADVAEYRVEQQQGGGDWEDIGRVPAETGRWDYRFTSPRLEDLASYAWRVVPIDAAGNDGTPVSVAAEMIVRTPDAPRFTATFDAGTSRVTIDAAA